jgi:raffinose/stachyose/melibiose transport system substrate-binding protein
MAVGTVKRRRVLIFVAAAAVLVASSSAGARLSTRSDAVTLSVVVLDTQKPGFDLLVPNFERVYPNIKVDITYVSGPPGSLEPTELALGTAPDVLSTFPGCGTPISVCALAKAGALAPMVRKPWAKRSLPLVTSLSKYGQGLYTFEDLVSPVGVFTNDDLFKKLGLKFPQTFSQFLDLCRKAKADGTVAFLDGNGNGITAWETLNLVTPAYVTDPHLTAEQRKGTKTFAGSDGWRHALQEYVEMNDAGCFEPGLTGTGNATARSEWALGQGLMVPGISAYKASLEVLHPQFGYSFRPFPNGSSTNRPTALLNLSPSLSVNAHSSPEHQAAAQTFIDFFARPKQNALYAQTQGGLTQYEFLHGQLPGFMSSFATVFEDHEYALNPSQAWWNPDVAAALQPPGLLTGQASIDGILNAMDAAWKKGPS